MDGIGAINFDSGGEANLNILICCKRRSKTNKLKWWSERHAPEDR